MTTHLKTFHVTLIIFLALLFSPPAPVNAQQTFGLSVDPPLVRIIIKPGRSLTQAINITNQSASPITLTPRLIPFSAQNTQGIPTLHPEETPPWLAHFSLANSNIKLNEAFTIPANKSQQLILALKIPENLPPQDIYAHLFVTSDPLTTNPSGHQLSTSIGANLLITVTKTEHLPTHLKISTFKFEKPPLIKLGNLLFYDNLSSLKLTTIVTNTSPFLAAINGQLLLTQDASIRAAQPVHPVYILANSQRELAASPSGSLSITPTAGQIGRYTAHLVIQTSTDSYTATIEFFLFPFKITLGILVFTLIFLTIIRRRRTPTTPS